MSWAPRRRVPGTDYRIVRLLGTGGMGEVFEVDDERTGRRLALKAVHRSFGRREDLAQRFRDEARVLGQLHAHPNLVEIVYAGETADGRAYLVMELLRGCSLEHELAAHRAAPSAPVGLAPWACAVAGQMLAALGAAHAIGVLHRDVKPANTFLLAQGGVKLLDFGLAGFLAPRSGVDFATQPGHLAGTPAYMPPERLQGGAADARTDVFSAGVVLWEMLAGERAIDAYDAHTAAIQMLARGVPSLGLRPGLSLPPSLVRVVDRATAREPGERFPSIEAFAKALRSVARGLDAPANPGPLLGLASAPGSVESASRSKAATRKVRFGVPTPPPSSPRVHSPVPFGVITLPRDRRGPSPSRRAAFAPTLGEGIGPVLPTLDVEAIRAQAAPPPSRALGPTLPPLAARGAAAWRALVARQRPQLRPLLRRVGWVLTLFLLAYVLGTLMARWLTQR
jgi:eukaryotic-like serine/threonine-protein kinase